MQRYYETTTSIPEFINKLEDAQKKTQRANVPIADSIFVAIATASTMASQMYPRTDDAWDDLSPSEKTWKKWKTTYTQAYNKSLIPKKSTVGTPQFGSPHLSPSEFSSTQHTPHQYSENNETTCILLLHRDRSSQPYDVVDEQI